MNDDPKMKPCPFCGGIRADTYHVRDGRVAMCQNCGAKSGSQYNGPLTAPSADDRAIAAWNRRATPPDVMALVEALRQIAERPDYRLPKAQDIARAALAKWEKAND